TLELIRRGLVVGIQDLGAGGISCPTSEMTSKAKTGIAIDLDRVHRREPGMEPFEVMISESQERMLAVVAPEDVDEVLGVCTRWGLEARVIGEILELDRVEVRADGRVVADVPADALAEEGPVYDRPMRPPEWLTEVRNAPRGDDPPRDLAAAFRAVLAAPNICSKRWVWEQYDHMIFLGTLIGPGGDAAVVRLPDHDVAVAITTDGPGRFCYLDPYEGARLAVCEAAVNVACTGARPLAITNCLNFGNPEKPGVMWQFAEVIRGMSDACIALATPVTGGNVSFYNETNGRAIYPTPVIGMLGVLEDPRAARGLGFSREGDRIVLLGTTDPGAFGGSEFAKVVHGAVGGLPPAVSLDAAVRLVRFLSDTDLPLVSAHDLSAGGLAIALTESAVKGAAGFTLEAQLDGAPHQWMFAESPSRALVSCLPTDVDDVMRRADAAGVPAQVVGTVGGDSLHFGAFAVALQEADAIYEGALQSLLSSSIG
ncbi:MAG: AIR synthase-related protein, partial [Actinomycetota bacterium]|nr:AIR synthase-related protein [Actinomycetota bacterium]